MEYGWVAHLCVGLYMVWLVVYFIWRKIWKQLGELLRTTRIPAWEIVLSVVGLLSGVAMESMHNCLAEELGEVVMYVGGVCILYLYSRDKVSKL